MVTEHDYGFWASEHRDRLPAVPGVGPTLVAVHDLLGRTLHASAEAISVLGVPAETLVGDAGGERIVDEHLDLIADAFEFAIKTTEPVAIVARHRVPNGEEWWILTHFRALPDPYEERTLFLAVSRQTTEPPRARFWSLAPNRPGERVADQPAVGAEIAPDPYAEGQGGPEHLVPRPQRGP